MKEFTMYLFKNSLECFSNFINCLLWDLITILIKESIAAEGSKNTVRCKNKIRILSVRDNIGQYLSKS